MFGIFKNKKEESKKTEQPKFLALVEKWENFLGKIETRFNESLVNAEEAIMGNLDESDYDLTPTLRAWQGIKSSLQDLSSKIETTFEEKVSEQMLEYIERYDLIDQSQKGVRLGEGIWDKIERFEIVLEGKVSVKFYEHAIEHLNEDFHCTQCNAKLEVRKDIFRSHYVSCDYCNTANTFTPNDKIVQIRWVSDNIAKYRALAEWDLMEKAENEFKEFRSPSEGDDLTEYTKVYKKREEALRVFWLKYFTERSVLLPEYSETIEHDINVKMKWFYEERKRELNF